MTEIICIVSLVVIIVFVIWINLESHKTRKKMTRGQRMGLEKEIKKLMGEW